MLALERTQSSQNLEDRLLTDLTNLQREAVTHQGGPLLIIAGAGTGKTTVITRRIAWLISTKQAKPNEILALTFTDKAAAEMEERVDILVPYGYMDVWLSTFHAFGDRLLREHALFAGISSGVRVLSRAEQIAFLRKHLFDLPLERFRPPHDPVRYLQALATVISRAKDEAVSPEEFLALAKTLKAKAAASPNNEEPIHIQAAQTEELADCYATYQRLLRQSNAIDFGDQILLAIQLLQTHRELLEAYQKQFRYILVDEFQDTNFAQFRLLQLLAAPNANVTVVADDDQSIYKWRGAAISNVLKFLEGYPQARRVVLTENFRSSQAVLDCAYRLIRFNDPDRLEVKEKINKRLTAMSTRSGGEQPLLCVFDTSSSEADWVARQIQAQVESGKRKPGDFAILVRTNREADLFLRALNVCALPWQCSGSGGLWAREEAKVLLSCLKALADPDDSISWYHVISSPLYLCPMEDLVKCMALANRTNSSIRAVFERLLSGTPGGALVSQEGRKTIDMFMVDVHKLVELSRTHSPGQLLYRWLSDRGWLKRLASAESLKDVEALKAFGRFFDQLHRSEELIGNRLPELIQSLELFEAIGDAQEEGMEPISSERINILTIHKAKGLEFPVVFLVGLVQGRFPTHLRHDPIELPEELIKDILPSGDYHLQEERRLFYVGMTRAKEQLYLTAAYDYGGRSIRKVSQFVLEALDVANPSPPAAKPSIQERIARAKPPLRAPQPRVLGKFPEPLRVDPHGVDDYLTCPLKFRYSHILRIPIMRHHLVIYGAAVHKAVEFFFRRKLRGEPVAEAELLLAFEEAWGSEGFLSREHEEMRLAQGREALKRFFAKQKQRPEQPSLIEEKFSFPVDDFLVVGRWDRVDCHGEEAVIIDYKSSEITDQAQANKRARDSLQMAVYALAWRMIHGRLPLRVELRFLETDMAGQAVFTEEDLEQTAERLREVARGIRALDFHPQPQDFSCRWCAYQSICAFAITK